MWSGMGYDLEIINFKKCICKFKYKYYKSESDEALRKKANIKKHGIKGRGRGRLGYCFCKDCAEKLKYKCPICKSKLIKIDGKNHAGGQWELRDGSQKAMPIKHAFS